MIFNIIMAITFATLACYSIFIYFKWKGNKEQYKAIGEKYPPLSFKGFWYRNKYQIALFMVFLFFVLSISFLLLII